jgi:hypothetical protein
LLLPLALAIGVSSARLHRLSGTVGLISENGPLMRLFADTDIGRVEASWTGPTGTPLHAWYSTGMKLPFGEHNTVRFHGYVGDPEILERLRMEGSRGFSPWERLVRRGRNVRLLVFGVNNYPNPEADFRGDPWRASLMRGYRLVLINVLLPLAAIGLWSMRKQRAAAIVVLANLATPMIVAAIFFSEARYRVPYDVFLIIAATVGATTLASQLDRLRRS